MRDRRDKETAVELTPRGTRGAALPAVPRPLLPVMRGLSVAFYRLLGGRVRVSGGPAALALDRGRPVGQGAPHRRGLVPDGEDAWLVVASYGGAPRHPAWYLNMAKHPDEVWIEIGGRKLRVRPETLRGAARAAAWGRIVAQAPGYGAYQEKTDREIPVVRLTPAA